MAYRLLPLMVLALLAGCSSYRPIPQPESAGVAPVAAPPPVSETGYYAACSGQVKGGHNGPWAGSLRSSEAQAQADAEAHNRQFRGHGAIVLHY